MPKKSEFLDVDPSIIEKNISFVKDWQEKDEMKDVFPFMQNAIIVKPTPGFCVKTKFLNDNKKLFINICHTESIPPPDDLSDDELMEVLKFDKFEYKIPMSIGESRSVKDKSGADSIAYDIAVNTKFCNKILASEVFRNFFLSICFEAVADKRQVEIDTESFVILKNRKCTGNLQTHRIQNRIADFAKNNKPFKPLIEDFNVDNEKKIDNKPEIPFQLIREPKEGKIKHLIAKFKINEKLEYRDIIIDLGEDRIVVETPQTKEIVDLFVPYIIRVNSAQAVLNKNTNILVITVAADDLN